MAHECPECGEWCHCGGDIDDILFDDIESYVKCRHYERRECAGNEWRGAPEEDG